MTSSQRKILSSAASNLNPLVIVGQNGLTDGIVQKVAKVIDDHELIKVKTGAECVRIIGNTAILYKESSVEEKRKHLI